jgi:hypothetical protein
MIAKPIPAHLRIPTHFSYFFESPPDVIIRNPHHKQRANATKDKIPNTQLIAV